MNRDNTIRGHCAGDAAQLSCVSQHQVDRPGCRMGMKEVALEGIQGSFSFPGHQSSLGDHRYEPH